MSLNETSTAVLRPIRELVCPDIEDSVDGSAPGDERRQSRRFTRRLPGAMIVKQAEYPVTCLDIGYGGMLLDAPHTANVALGDRVTVRIELGGKSFEDEFSVVRTERTATGMAVHLGL